MISQTKPLKMKYFLQFDFAITNICVAMRLAENGTSMGGIEFQLFTGIFVIICRLFQIALSGMPCKPENCHLKSHEPFFSAHRFLDITVPESLID